MSKTLSTSVKLWRLITRQKKEWLATRPLDLKNYMNVSRSEMYERGYSDGVRDTIEKLVIEGVIPK